MLTKDEKRFYQRNLTKKGNYSLNQTAKNAGVKNFDKIVINYKYSFFISFFFFYCKKFKKMIKFF